MKKNRGILLTLLIVLIGLSDISGLVDSSAYRTVAIIVSLLGLISLVGMWLWKKWALYLQIALYTISFVASLFLLKTPQVMKDYGITYYPFFAIWMVFWGIIPGVLGYIALRKKWKYFE